MTSRRKRLQNIGERKERDRYWRQQRKQEFEIDTEIPKKYLTEVEKSILRHNVRRRYR